MALPLDYAAGVRIDVCGSQAGNAEWAPAFLVPAAEGTPFFCLFSSAAAAAPGAAVLDARADAAVALATAAGGELPGAVFGFERLSHFSRKGTVFTVAVPEASFFDWRREKDGAFHVAFADEAAAAEFEAVFRREITKAELAAEGATSERDNACLGCMAVLTVLQFVPFVGPFFGIPIIIWNCYVARKDWRVARIAAAGGAQKGAGCCATSKACETCDRGCDVLCCMPATRIAVLTTANPAAAAVTGAAKG